MTRKFAAALAILSLLATPALAQFGSASEII